MTEAKGVLVVAAFVLPAALLTWAVIRALVGLRVEPAEEVAGLDHSEMGMEAYPVEAVLSVQTLLDTSIVTGRRPVHASFAGGALGRTPMTVAFPTPAPAFPHVGLGGS